MISRLNRKAIATLVATVLLILITVAAVGIIERFVLPIVSTNLGWSAACSEARITINTGAGYSCFYEDIKKAGITIYIPSGNFELRGVGIILKGNGRTESFVVRDNLTKKETEVTYLLSTTLDDIEGAGIAPILKIGDGEKRCGISHKTYLKKCIKESTPVGVPIEVANCSDGMQNQNEVGIDCGGVCIVGTEILCSDGIDNDKDCLIDAADPDCFIPAPTCSDGVKNGNETGIDCGAECIVGNETLCSDGIDNDKDCLVDAADSDCSGAYLTTWIQVPLRSENQKAAGLEGGEGMQMIQTIAYAPSNPQILYLGSDTSQVWKSTDGGKTWRMKHNGFYSNGALSIVVDPLNEDVVFAAGTIGYPIDRYQPTNPLGGIFRTTNGGETWQLLKTADYFKREDGDSGGKVFAFATTSSDIGKTRIIYSGTYKDGLFKSTDYGDTWNFLGLQDINIFDLKINPQNKSILFIAAIQGIYKYDDASGSITQIGAGLPDYPRTIAINPQNPDILYAAVGSSGVYRSVDGGVTFTARNNGLTLGKSYIHMALSPANPDYLYVSINKNGNHIPNPFYSHDGGASWYTPQTIDQGNLALFGGEEKYFSAQIEPHPTDQNIAFTAGNGKARVLKTTDGGNNWFWSSSGYSGSRMGIGKTSHAFYPDNKMIFFLIDFGPAFTEDGDIFRMLPVEKVYTSYTSNSVGAVGYSSSSNVIVAAIGVWQQQFLEISRDNGNTWEIISNTEDNYAFISFHPQKPNVIYAQGFISEDTGNSWTQLSKKIYAVYRGNGDIVYSFDDVGGNKVAIRRSNDMGKTWTISYPEIDVKASQIREIDVDSIDFDRVYVATGKGLYIYDNGEWKLRGEESGLTKDYFGLTAVKNVAVDTMHPNVVYAGKEAPGKGHSNGVFRSTDYGETWESVTYNIEQPFTPWSIAVSPNDGTVYIGSSHGAWKLPPPY